METSLILPSAITKKVQPKPTKTEMIEALARRKLAQLANEKTEAEARYKKLGHEITEGLRVYAEKNAKTLFEKAEINDGTLYNQNAEWRYAYVKLQIDNPPAELFRKKREMESLQRTARCGLPSMSDVRRSVRNSIDGIIPSSSGQRVDAMLNDSGMAKALDKMLEQMDAAANKPAVT